jgi:sugar transferase (PEP-CTERM/EpsH1 system associated)
MKILLVTLNVPCPTWGAGTRNYHMLRALAGEHEVSLLALVDDLATGERDAAALRSLTHTIRLVPMPMGRHKRAQQLLCAARGRSYWLNAYCPEAARVALDELLRQERYDAVVFESVLVAGFPVPAGVRVVVDQHNIEHELVWRTYERETDPLRKWYNRLEYGSLRAGELARCRRADVVFVPSDRERELLAGLLPGSAIEVMPNGVDLAAFSADGPREEVPGRIIFTGTLAYYPNAQAVLHFAEHCWPLIHARVPEATWQIVGREPPEEVRQLAALPGVSVTGMVPSIQPYLAAASVAIVPLLVGSGTRLKILEALAAGKALVTTRLGCEGIAITPGVEALVADEPGAFAAAVVELLGDARRRADLGAAGRALVERQYGWDACVAPLLRALSGWASPPAPLSHGERGNPAPDGGRALQAALATDVEGAHV